MSIRGSGHYGKIVFGPDGAELVVINLRCAEDVDLSTLRISQFDGESL